MTDTRGVDVILVTPSNSGHKRRWDPYMSFSERPGNRRNSPILGRELLPALGQSEEVALFADGAVDWEEPQAARPVVKAIVKQGTAEIRRATFSYQTFFSFSCRFLFFHCNTF